MNFTEKWGTDVETAVSLALEELGATREEVDIDVLEEPSRGFFGIGSKLALVRVSLKNPVQEVVEEEVPAFVGEENKVKKTETRKNKDNKRDLGKNKKNSSNSKRNGGRNNGRKVEKRDYDKLAEEVDPIMPIVDESSLTPLTEHEVITFVEKIIKEMGLEVQATAKTDGKDIFIYLDGKDTGSVIGKFGSTLDAIQYLASLVVNKEGGEYKRVVIDAENYRAKREKSLEKLAMRLADKVVRSGRSYKLEPMNPYERKVIHSTLQKDGRVTTRSEGQDPYRRIIIDLK